MIRPRDSVPFVKAREITDPSDCWAKGYHAQQAVQGSIIYNCPPPINPTVTVDGGLHLSGGQRNMLLTTGPDLLRYGLFFDAACTQVISPTATTAIAAGSGTITFYACLPPLQDVSVGSYGDTVTVTFNF